MSFIRAVDLSVLLVLITLGLCGPVHAQTQAYFEENQALTRAVPSSNPSLLPASAGRPLPLAGVTRYRITVCPASGQALTGTGSIRLYLFNQYMLRWGYNPQLDQSVSITGSVVNMCQIFGFNTDIRRGWLLPAAVGVGVTGGTTVTVRVEPDNF